MLKTYVCRKIQLYNFLTARGFKPFRVAPDKWDAARLVWLYDATPELAAAVTEYYEGAE